MLPLAEKTNGFSSPSTNVCSTFDWTISVPGRSTPSALDATKTRPRLPLFPVLVPPFTLTVTLLVAPFAEISTTDPNSLIVPPAPPAPTPPSPPSPPVPPVSPCPPAPPSPPPSLLSLVAPLSSPTLPSLPSPPVPPLPASDPATPESTSFEAPSPPWPGAPNDRSPECPRGNTNSS